ncbi:MAG: hypothetical protein HW418_3171 [Anaerolineales bacterium]|nr:hypothetical protein [Anaerolineales bacterium]
MNKGEFEGKWMQLRVQVRDWWGKLAAADLDRVAGNFDQFIGLLQEKYGYTRRRAEEEFYRRMALLREMRVEEESKQRLAQHAARQQSGVPAS